MSRPVYGQKSLKEQDPDMFAIIEKEYNRQVHGIELIASENFTSRAVMECLGSCMTNKYSEGYPGVRYYGGTEHIDEMETLCIKRALEAFRLNPAEWGVNVQPYSGSPANFAAYTAVLAPHDRLMGLDLPSGGHLTHGFYTAQRKVSATSMFWESMPYKVHPATGLVDLEKLREHALIFRPKLIICGGSAYAREWDYAAFRKIADEVGAMLMCDMAHFAGLVATQVLQNPFEYADIVTSTTHKSLRGPRAGLIFFKKDAKDAKKKLDLENKINNAVFPGCQGGPHNNAISGVCVQMAEVMTEEFKQYSVQSVKNSKALAAALMKKGYKLVTDGTDNHLNLWDLRPLKLTGSKLNCISDLVHITLNKNSVPGDVSALVPGGVRLGSPAMTSRGLVEDDFEKIADYLERAVNIAIKINAMALEANKGTPDEGKCLQKHFDIYVPKCQDEIDALKKDVFDFSTPFPLPGLKP